MKTLILAAIRCSLMFTAVAAGSFVHSAQAYLVTLEQVGSNVVATGSGPLDLTGLTFANSFSIAPPNIVPRLGQLLTGHAAASDFYHASISGGISGPQDFGSGFNFNLGSMGIGDRVGIIRTLGVVVPSGYVSGTALSSSATWNSATVASLGVTPGTYVWSWGAGANQDFTLIIRGAGVPDGGSTVSLLGFALVGLTALRRRLSC